jgi:hypothetical protein
MGLPKKLNFLSPAYILRLSICEIWINLVKSPHQGVFVTLRICSCTWRGFSREQMTVKVTMSEKSMVTRSYFWHTSMLVFPSWVGHNLYQGSIFWSENSSPPSLKASSKKETFPHRVQRVRIRAQVNLRDNQCYKIVLINKRISVAQTRLWPTIV